MSNGSQRSLEKSGSVWFTLLVSKYSTPLAVWLVCVGMYLYRRPTKVYLLSAFLLTVGAVLNMLYPYLVIRLGEVKPRMANARLIINLCINAVFVYYWGDVWPPIWLLFVLTPVATAIYGSRTKTIAVSASVAALLVIIQFTRSSQGLSEWAKQITYAHFIVVLSLIINELARLAKRNLSAFPSAAL